MQTSTKEDPRFLGDEIWNDYTLDYCWQHDVITVTAAGNAGLLGQTLDQTTPQKHGTPSNGLITVGGVEVNGVLYPETNRDRGQGGSLTLYAIARDVAGASFQDDSGSRTETGTSMAARAVAGLAAYFASLE